MSRGDDRGGFGWSRSVEVGRDGERTAVVHVARTRRPVEVHRFGAGRRSEPPPTPTATPVLPAVGADPTAWPERSADGAARERWHDRHPAVATVQRLRLADPDDHQAAASAMDQAGADLVATGIRRIDVLLAPTHPLVAELTERGWIAGRIAEGVVLSRPLRYPWRLASDFDPRASAALDHLPTRARRVLRRATAMHPIAYAELMRTAAAELAEASRQAYAPGRAREAATAGSPDGTTPFAVTRYRTLRAAFALVPAAMWATTFVDIGAGDGRVLREATAAGAANVVGWELDPALALRAARVVDGGGTVEAGDALAHPLADEVGIVFLNNPFGPASVTRLAGRIADSLAARPRPLLVVYINPRTVEPFLDAGLVLVHSAPAYSILTTRSA